MPNPFGRTAHYTGSFEKVKAGVAAKRYLKNSWDAFSPRLRTSDLVRGSANPKAVGQCQFIDKSAVPVCSSFILSENMSYQSVESLTRRLRTPHQVQRWLLTLKYNKKDTMRTIRGVLKFREAHCLEAALTAAAILEHHGYPPLILDLDSTDLLGHTLFLYRQNSRYGAVGFSRDVGLNGRKPIYKTIRALVQSYAAPYIDTKAGITRYGVLDLQALRDARWRSSDKYVWYIEKALQNMPHQRLKTSQKFIRIWRRRYVQFKKTHPHQQPKYYPNQKNWA